ncbi:MAG TPA: LuxR C-terminal-related transcriptional regulator [Gaiellaceae bacterium]|nr:LuxR C-terminal-related transcriptional regulator [Gaiellaceae bacterium]
MRLVFEGERVVDTAHPRRPVGQRPLSLRERELLRLAAAGSTNREIASVMGVGSETVKTMLSRTFSKLGVRNRTEAVAVAKERGLL